MLVLKGSCNILTVGEYIEELRFIYFLKNNSDNVIFGLVFIRYVYYTIVPAFYLLYIDSLQQIYHYALVPLKIECEISGCLKVKIISSFPPLHIKWKLYAQVVFYHSAELS